MVPSNTLKILFNLLFKESSSGLALFYSGSARLDSYSFVNKLVFGSLVNELELEHKFLFDKKARLGSVQFDRKKLKARLGSVREQP